MGTPALAPPETIHLDNSKTFADLPDGGTPLEVATAAVSWLTVTLQGMCQHADHVFTTARIRDTGMSFTIEVHPDDYRYVVGKAGRNMRSMRTIFYSMGKRYRSHFELILAEPKTPEAAHGESRTEAA